MDSITTGILNRINLHLKIRRYLTVSSYFLIIGGFLVYAFYAINSRNAQYKLVSDYKENPQHYTMEKIMTNPRIKFQYNDNQIYEIEAKKAVHKNDEEVTLYDVYGVGDIGNISAGELQIDEQGDHLVFTQSPVLILNNTD